MVLEVLVVNKKIILSGTRPTGSLHLGNYVGAISNWVKLQNEYQCFYMIADYHALTSEYENTSEIKNNIYEVALDWLACGLTPEKSVLFIQSKVPQHCELHLILSMFTPLSWLERCPTYKEQLREVTTRDLSNYGFLGYPVLQAADILIYQADCVPVGEDQEPHLELTREIARRVNNFYGKVFVEPQSILTKTPRLLGTDNRKMSKSYNNCIYLSDDEETTRKQIKSMITDPQKIKRNDVGHPEICNVFSYHNYFTKEQVEQIEKDCHSGILGCVDCKENLNKQVNNLLAPIREKRKELAKDKNKVLDIIFSGSKLAQETAENNLNEIKEKINLNLLRNS